MEDKKESQEVHEELKASQPIETNYPEHQADPAPAEEAVFEEDKNGASKILKWIIPALVVILAIVWLIMM